MDTDKKTARIVGVLFLTAMVTSLLGGGILETMLSAPGYLINIYPDKTQVIIGVLLELVNSIAVVGIAVLMFAIFKKGYEALALGYISFRVLEATVCILAVIGPLSLIKLSQKYLEAGAPGASHFQTLGDLVIATRANLTGLILVIFFSLSALIFYYILYQSKLVPRFISVWGFIAAILVLSWNVLETFDIRAGIILALPIILNEIFLGIWLIVKGFNPSAIVSASAKADIN